MLDRRRVDGGGRGVQGRATVLATHIDAASLGQALDGRRWRVGTDGQVQGAIAAVVAHRWRRAGREQQLDGAVAAIAGGGEQGLFFRFVALLDVGAGVDQLAQNLDVATSGGGLQGADGQGTGAQQQARALELADICGMTKRRFLPFIFGIELGAGVDQQLDEAGRAVYRPPFFLPKDSCLRLLVC